MKDAREISILNEFDSNQNRRKNLPLPDSKIRIFKIILLLSILVFALLFFPFAKSAALAVVFSFAILGVKDRTRALSKKNKYLLFSSIGLAGLILITLTISLVKMILSTIRSVSDPSFFDRLKLTVSEFFFPTLKIVEQLVTKIAHQFDKSKPVEASLSESAIKIFDSLVNFLLSWLSEMPNNILQLCFFIFLVIFLLRKADSIKQFGSAFFSKKHDETLGFLISTAKNNGYTAVVMTILIAFTQAFVLTVGAILVGISVWPIVFISSFISALIPIIGTLPVTVACAIYVGSEISVERAVAIGLFGLAASLIDNVLRTYLVSGDDSSLNPFLCFFALIGSLFIFGFAGLFIGPFVIAFTSTIFKRYKIL